mgnify:CR=1 FL=1
MHPGNWRCGCSASALARIPYGNALQHVAQALAVGAQLGKALAGLLL